MQPLKVLRQSRRLKKVGSAGEAARQICRALPTARSTVHSCPRHTSRCGSLLTGKSPHLLRPTANCTSHYHNGHTVLGWLVKGKSRTRRCHRTACRCRAHTPCNSRTRLHSCIRRSRHRRGYCRRSDISNSRSRSSISRSRSSRSSISISSVSSSSVRHRSNHGHRIHRTRRMCPRGSRLRAITAKHHPNQSRPRAAR